MPGSASVVALRPLPPPPFQRPPESATPAIKEAWNQLVNQLEIQFRRLSTAAASNSFPGFAFTWDWPATATGTNQATAYLLKAYLTVVTSVPAGTGVVMFDAPSVLWGTVINADPSNGLWFYPYGTTALNGGGAGVGVPIPPGSVANWSVNPTLGTGYIR